jgi:excisionase family DNA binding protein
MLTIAEAAKTFNLSAYFVRALALSGKVAAVRAGTGKNGKILVNAKSLEQYLENATLTDENADD